MTVFAIWVKLNQDIVTHTETNDFHNLFIVFFAFDCLCFESEILLEHLEVDKGLKLCDQLHTLCSRLGSTKFESVYYAVGTIFVCMYIRRLIYIDIFEMCLFSDEVCDTKMWTFQTLWSDHFLIDKLCLPNLITESYRHRSTRILISSSL